MVAGDGATKESKARGENFKLAAGAGPSERGGSEALEKVIPLKGTVER